MTVPYPEGLLVHQIFERQVLRSPEALALAGSEGSLTYQQLNDRAVRIAGALANAGGKQGGIIGTYFERCQDVIASFIGILKLGATYCPLDVTHPMKRTEYILQDSQPAVVITCKKLQACVPKGPWKVLVVDEPGALDARRVLPVVECDPRRAMYIMYTSGSTGQPKGVMVPHEGVIRLFFGVDYLPFGPEMRILQQTPLGFDVSTQEIWGPLLHGGLCVLSPYGRAITPYEMRRAVVDYKLNCISLTPAVFNLLIDEDPQVFAGVANIIIGGEAASAVHVRKAMANLPDVGIINGYGPTEATVWATAYRVPRDFPKDATAVPIGKPINRTTCYILDSQGQPVAGDTPGELFIGGQGVALGYWNKPELTHARFVPDPFAPAANIPLYRTGDLCRWLPDGNIDFMGRMDFQIKVRGIRIEPAEIEAVMYKHPGVGQGVVVPHGKYEDMQLLAYYTLSGRVPCSPEELRTLLEEYLPPSVVPHFIMPLERMPLNANGKVDRQALPEPPRVARNAREPASDAERELLALWKEVLHDQNISVDDGFFAMGGTSLRAVRLCIMIERLTGSLVPIAMLIEHSSPAKMARAIAGMTPAATAQRLVVRLGGGDKGEPLFCVTGTGGHAMAFIPMVQHLSHPGPVWGLQFPGLDGVTTPAQSVGDMAKIFIEQMRRIHPAGPYHLLGYSFGGVVVYEIAQQLRHAGHPVGMLIMIDAPLEHALRTKPFRRRLRVHLRRILQGRFGGLKKRWLVRRKDTWSYAEISSEALDPAPSVLSHSIVKVSKFNDAAHEAYVPQPYSGDMTYILCKEQPDWYEFYDVQANGGWTPYAKGKFTVLHTSGNHISLLHEPHVEELAKHVDACMVAGMKPSLRN